MKKLTTFATLLLLLSITAYAADLENFPENWIKNDRLDGYIVVGKEADSLDVISQSRIGLAIAGYVGAPQLGISKLDVDVSLDNNLILIGNACDNHIAKFVLDTPDPCDSNIPEGKAIIEYIEDQGNAYIVIAGRSSEATKEAADYFIEHLTKLRGSKIAIDVDAPEIPRENTGTAGNDDDEANGEKEETEEQSSKEATKEQKPATDEGLRAGNNNEQPSPQGSSEPKEEPKVVVVQEKGFIQKILDWFGGLFS